jgi:hypothetical protein
LVSKEFRYGSKNTIFFFAVIVPVALSLVISLLVGTLFAGRPRLGVADLGSHAWWKTYLSWNTSSCGNMTRLRN